MEKINAGCRMKYYEMHEIVYRQKQLEEFKVNGFEIVEIEKISEADGGYDLVAFLKLR